MQVPLEIPFHNMEPSEFIEAEVRERVDKLELLQSHYSLQRQH